jgi:hypothetical protein
LKKKMSKIKLQNKKNAGKGKERKKKQIRERPLLRLQNFRNSPKLSSLPCARPESAAATPSAA